MPDPPGPDLSGPAPSAPAYRLVRPASAGAEPAELVIDEPAARVIGHREGPLLVYGGPGSGKTTCLVEAVRARVAEEVEPSRVLVLTFGRRGADALRTRVEAALGVAPDGSGRVIAEPLVRTFHAYAFGLLRRAAAERGEPPPRLLSGPEQDLMIRELLVSSDAGAWPAVLAPALRTKAFAAQLRDLLLRAAERGVDAARLAELGRVHHRPEWSAAAAFLDEYNEIMALRDATGRSGAGYDNAEIVRAAIRLLRGDPARLEGERRRLRHVYVDEFADTDPAQVELLRLVAGGGAHLVAFADPDTATYGFRGGDPSAVTGFPERFATASGAPAPVVVLARTYRMAGSLLDAATRVSSRLRGPARARAMTPAPGVMPGEVEAHTFRTPASESAFVAHKLREAYLIDGVPWDRMAVIVKSTALRLPSLRRALHHAGVPTETFSEDVPVTAQPAVTPLLLALRCALDPAKLDEEAAVALLHSPIGGADPLAERRLRQELRAIAAAAGVRRPSGDLLVEALNDPLLLTAAPRRWADPAYAVAGTLAAARAAARATDATAEDVLWALWQSTGLAERWSATSAKGGERGMVADRDLDAVVALFETAARFADRMPGARAELFLEQFTGQELPGDSLAPTARRGAAVRVLTAHAAKGLEWDVVVIAGAQEGLWPDLRLRGTVLGSERLVDVVAGRAGTPPGPGAASGSGVVAAVAAATETATLLDEERRLFYTAVTRARRRLVVTAQHSGDGEEQPSRFLRELAPLELPPRGSEADETAEPEPTRLPRALTLEALVAELRVALLDPASADKRRRAAAAQLRRLADAGVPGAAPRQWWGLPALSDDGPLFEGETVFVSPSNVELVRQCGLRWLLERHGGSDVTSFEQGVGNLVHDIATRADAKGVGAAELMEFLTDRFGEIELSARWLADRERSRAERMIANLVGWLAQNPRRLVAIEQEFLAELGDNVTVRGRVDRLEMDSEGRLVVIDLKTGKSTARADEIAEHPQLGAYQAAVAAGAFDAGDTPGGAALVQLGANKTFKEQPQPPLAEADDPAWAHRMVKATARTMAASTFHAVANAKCRNCPVRRSCPVSGQGRQVTDGSGAA